MTSRAKISAAEFVQDLRSGFTSCELMDKYSVTARELDGVLAQIKKAFADPAELYGRLAPNEVNEKTTKFRFLRRHKIDLPVLIYDSKNPTIRGEIRDISEKGIRIQKMDTKLDEIKSLVVLANEYFSIAPFGFQAQCRWTSPTTDERGMLAGFEIIKISEESLKSLAKFIETYDNFPYGSEAKSAVPLSGGPDSRATRSEAIWTCPFCEMPQTEEFEECPQCGIIVSKYLFKLESNRSEVADTIEKRPRSLVTTTPKRNSLNEKAITVSDQVWKQLESLGGNPHEHFNNALSTYLLRAKINQNGK
ncbi:MAG: PilZ domain-containing protein [Desulfomonilaceae bacterium]